MKSTELTIKYRFFDDPEDVIREHPFIPKWDEKNNAFEIMPPQDKPIIILYIQGYKDESN